MQRRSFLTGAGLASLALMTSCSKDDGGSDATEITPETEATLTLAYWDKNQTPTVKENIKRFNEQYPKIKVTTNVAGYEDWWKKLRTQAQGDELPDVFWMNGPNIELYAGNDMLEPLDDVTELDVDWGNYPEALVELYTVEDKHYGIPKDFDTIAVWYNKTIFDEAKVDLPKPGWTWDDFHTAAKAVSDWGKSKGVYGAVLGYAENQSTYYNTIPQAGGEFITDGKSGFGSPEAIKGLKVIADWAADGSAAPVDVVTDLKAANMFITGKAAMFWCGDWKLPEFQEAFKGKEKDIDVIELPKGEKQATVIHGLSWAVSAKSKAKAAAKALAAWMGSKDSALVEANNGTAIPAFNGTQDAWVKTVPDWNLQAHIDAAEYAVPYPTSKNSSAWEDRQSEFFLPAFSGEKSVEQAATEYAKFMDDALAKEQ
ncbi:sugar ABC transporter substrate-binding protein [uncultured Tessaracoccus sp.]|uniref:ABC transporter substrate-binding protein n=1 Tax=uncultured Tessaracoccus sp. TaxID=905023 RepID=UPI0025E28842|nr:sugar ABC transporter substrate-binding protein [uncultured Tessaracoccus sp.]